jgi:hypothetical protein
VALNPEPLFWKMFLRVPTRNVREFSAFAVCPSDKHCPTRCAYAANAVSKDFHIFPIGPVSLNRIL